MASRAYIHSLPTAGPLTPSLYLTPFPGY